jgi:hypothetical protein
VVLFVEAKHTGTKSKDKLGTKIISCDNMVAE